ncbi:MAG: AAA family ATPase [Lachnospiraceae bacterium]|nr:AAA family ATPase [Lachnospiraceae bacterium]
MRLLDLHIDGFGKFHDRSVRFEDGLNIVYGKNEAGKSTLHTFIRCMLFGLERGRGRASKSDLYSRFEPWQNKAAYGGQLRLEKDGIRYRIERNFQKDQKSLTVINETAGKEMDPTKAFMDSLLCGLTETTYNNTISIGQLKSATDGGMVAELRNYIANMNTTGNMALNITKAVTYLKTRRREFERQLVPEAAKNYTTLLGEIRNVEKEISAPEYENQLQAYQSMRTQVKSLLSEKQEEREALLQKIAKGRQALAGAQFTDEASISAYQNEAKQTYGQYQLTKSSSEQTSRTVFAMLSLSFAVIAGIGTALLALIASGQSLPLITLEAANQALAAIGISAGFLAVTAGALTLIFLITGIALLLKQKSLKKEAAMISKILQEIFSRHLGDASISPEAMTAFDARMNEFLRLSKVLERSETTVMEQAAEISSLQEKETTCEDVISRQQRTQWELEKKLEHLTHCKDQVEALKHTLEENERVREEITAIDLALDTMTELSASIRDSFGLYLNKTASDLIDGITGGIYDSMSVDENLNVFMNTRTKLVPVEQVSSGTMDQVYLALRLAAAKLIQNGGEQLPLIFDDSFVLYDDERLRTALKWLSKAYDGQVIIFTCHQREAQMLTANQVGYHLVTM